VGGLKPTQQQLEALARLRGSHDFGKFLELVREYEALCVEQMIGAQDESVIRAAQGGVRALRILRITYESAPDQLDRMSGKSRNTP
jgi:hypothetical protein